MTTPLSLEITGHAEATCVAAAGEVDFASLGELERTLTHLDAHRRVELDLSGVSFIDSSGLAMLLSMRNLFAEGGGMLVLRAPSQKVRRVFELSGLSAAFTVVE